MTRYLNIAALIFFFLSSCTGTNAPDKAPVTPSSSQPTLPSTKTPPPTTPTPPPSAPTPTPTPNAPTQPPTPTPNPPTPPAPGPKLATDNPLAPDADSRFEVEDFGGGGHCFFYSVAGMLGRRGQQQWVREQMADYVRKASQFQKQRWLDLIQIYKTDPLMKRHYAGVNSIDDFALRLENKAPFHGVYQGDQLSLGIAEETFDLTLAPIDNIKPKPEDNSFKQGPTGNRFRKRLAFLRQVGGDASGHFQVHEYVDAKNKKVHLIFNLEDPDSIPLDVRNLIQRYATQYNVISQHIKTCRPLANVCSQFSDKEVDCKTFAINHVKFCIWTDKTPARCEGIAGCSTAQNQLECGSFEKDGVPVCYFEQAIDSCEELRLAGSEVGCRALENPTLATCSQVVVTRNTKSIPKFCTFIAASSSNCEPKISVNPCAGRCGTDPHCEMR